ncbi:phosphoinositide phospholipase C 6-like [Chenopodium quinoa]|uniref:Phosphoinositide phospholipase C n=1 Tax=Chenopodium quinoa TaxID=63459 RepID=A0A803KRH7_CHEQI|nr:phosphoinositide phospholipase C 6-like [Chenopodium quinoa]
MESFRIFGCFTRKFVKAELQPPSDIKQFFDKYAECGPQMTAEHLQKLMIEVQGESKATTLADAEKIIEEIKSRRKHPHMPIFSNTARKTLSLDEFFSYLFSTDLNPPINPQVHQDMNAPISHYFIYTGHNSYLTGNQISSDCSDVPIIQALQRGVRVIELDLWPTPNKQDVHVLHGKTLTTPVDLLKCLKSIKEYAFCASPYPVILTLEDHLNPTLQAKVAEMIIQVFEDMLFYPETEILKDFPSPEELKYKVLVSTKPPKEYLTAENAKNSSGSKEPSIEEQEFKANNEKSGNGNSVEREVCDYDDPSLQERPAEYKKMITIPGIKRGELKESLKVDPIKVSRLSWSEQLLAKATTSHGTRIIRYTQKNILRIFPKVTRFNSSNYEPILGWMYGAQMVAFNMQGHGKQLWLMHGMFRANGGCGYVKKPDFLLNSGPDDQVFDPKADSSIKTTLKVKVYIGDGWREDFRQTHFDTFSPPDFYVKVGIAGAPADKLMKKTKVIEDHWRPAWNEEFSFPLTVPELALLRIEVHEYDTTDKDDFGGQSCLPVRELKPGIHAVPLYNYKGEKYASVKLLMQFIFA